MNRLNKNEWSRIRKRNEKLVVNNIASIYPRIDLTRVIEMRIVRSKKGRVTDGLTGTGKTGV